VQLSYAKLTRKHYLLPIQIFTEQNNGKVVMRKRKQVDGILLLDKPTGLTSNGALQRVKRLFNANKAGHTGSLDLIATGMLPICFGEATKFSQFLLESDKSYRVTATLGVKTTTGDTEGSVVATQPVVGITAERMKQVMQRFVGIIEQVPPMYSAIKHQGTPLYRLARQGIEVERKPRQVRIDALILETLHGNQFSFQVQCSKGTYVRMLVEDLAQELNSYAHVTQLRRVTVTPYHNAVMYTLPALEEISNQVGYDGLCASLLPVESSVQVFPLIKLSTSAAFYLRMGQPVRTRLPLSSSLVRLVSEDARFLGIGEVMTDGRVRPYRLVSTRAGTA
jgi:tRNA pseudouridine55 synthase